MENKNEKKEKIKVNKPKMRKGELFGKILAGVMAMMMLVAACSTCIYFLVNQ